MSFLNSEISHFASANATGSASYPLLKLCVSIEQIECGLAWCVLIDNDAPHHSGQSAVDSRGAAA